MENRKQRLVTSYESWNKETAALFELKSSLEKMTVSSITQTQLLSYVKRRKILIIGKEIEFKEIT
jgi:hypothetical protein